MGLELVRVRVLEAGERRVQIMVDRQEEGGINLDDCARLSRAMRPLLDTLAPGLALEVSSPGVDRPLTRPADFSRFAGARVGVETATPLAGRRRFRGTLLGWHEPPAAADGAEAPAGEVALQDDEAGELHLPFADLASARILPDRSPGHHPRQRRPSPARNRTP